MNPTGTPIVEIPADVKDNSTHSIRIQWRSTRDASPHEVGSGRRHLATFGYTLYEWDDTDRDGTRVTLHRFVNREGHTVDLFATYYFTRTACAECEYSYASVYQVIQTEDGMSDAVPRCDEHADRFRRAIAGEPGVILHESERLRIGEHD